MVLRRVPLLRRTELHRRHVENLRPERRNIARPGRLHLRRRNHPTTLVPNNQDLDKQAVGGDTWTRGETLNLTWQASQGTSSRSSATSTSGWSTATTARDEIAGGRHLLHASARIHPAEHLEQPVHQQAAPRRRLHLLQRAVDLRAAAGQRQRLRAGRRDFEDRELARPDLRRGQRLHDGLNHQYNMRAAANYVTGSHAFKFGMQDMWGTRNTATTRTSRKPGPSPAAFRSRLPSTRGRSSITST